jgi:hypothetical protein
MSAFSRCTADLGLGNSAPCSSGGLSPSSGTNDILRFASQQLAAMNVQWPSFVLSLPRHLQLKETEDISSFVPVMRRCGWQMQIVASACIGSSTEYSQ